MTIIGQSGGKGNQTLEISLLRAEYRISDLVQALARAEAEVFRLEEHIRKCQEKERERAIQCAHGFPERGRYCPECKLAEAYSSPSDVMAEAWGTCPACEGKE